MSVIVKALAPALNTMLFTCIRLERERPVMLDVANVAVSVGELGTVAGIQLAAVFQSPVPGAAFHVALPAKLMLAAANRNNSTVGITTNHLLLRRFGARAIVPGGKVMRL